MPIIHIQAPIGAKEDSESAKEHLHHNKLLLGPARRIRQRGFGDYRCCCGNEISPLIGPDLFSLILQRDKSGEHLMCLGVRNSL